MAPKFLCCLPLRFGVFVISLLQFLVTGGYAGFLWWAFWYESENDGEHFPCPYIVHFPDHTFTQPLLSQKP